MAKVTLGVKNYQSIENTLLTFEPGITVITGSSNSGKTALFRAAWSLIMNPSASKHHIRDDAQEAVVFLHVENHPKIIWRRKRNTVEYEIDGEVNHKAGRNTIWDLYPEFPLKRESTGEILNFHREHNILFPFGLSPQELFKQFEKVMSIDDSATILKSLKSAKSDLASERGSTHKHVEAAARIITNITTTVVMMSNSFATEEGSLRLLHFLLQDQDHDQVIELEYIKEATESFFRPLEKGDPVNQAPVEDPMCTCPPLDPEEAPCEGGREGKNVSPMETPVESVSRVGRGATPHSGVVQDPLDPVISGTGAAQCASFEEPRIESGIVDEGVHSPLGEPDQLSQGSCNGTEGLKGSEGNLGTPGGKDSDGHPEPDAVQRIEEVKQTLRTYLRVSEPLEADIAALKLLVPRLQLGTLKVAAAQKAAERLETDLKGQRTLMTEIGALRASCEALAALVRRSAALKTMPERLGPVDGGVVRIRKEVEDDLKAVQGHLISRRRVLDSAEAAKKRLKEVEQGLAQFKACPLCQRPWTEEHSHA